VTRLEKGRREREGELPHASSWIWRGKAVRGPSIKGRKTPLPTISIAKWDVEKRRKQRRRPDPLFSWKNAIDHRTPEKGSPTTTLD